MPRNSITGESTLTGGGNDESSTLFTVTNGATIPTAGLYTTRVTAAGAVTGVILQPGAYPGQEIMVVHEGAAGNTITPAVAATSNIADGVSGVIAGLTAKGYVWDSITQRWYRES
jgi:hypothetical protein